MPIETDDLNRADEDPLSDGGQWLDGNGPDRPELVDNEIRATTDNEQQSTRRDISGIGADQYSEGEVRWVNACQCRLGFAVRMASGAQTFYVGMFEEAGSEVLSMWEVTNGTFVQLGTDFDTCWTAKTGSTIRTAVTGSTISIWLNGVFMFEQTDATITSGDVGVNISFASGEDVTEAGILSWRGGSGGFEEGAVDNVNYNTALDNLSPDHRWDFSANGNDQIGSLNITPTGTIDDPPIAENCLQALYCNNTTDRAAIPTSTDVDNFLATRKAVCGWFLADTWSTPPACIYTEGDENLCFNIIYGYGNNVMAEVRDDPDFAVQIYGPPLQRTRPYNFCLIFSGNGYDNEVKFFVDGVKQLDAQPADRQPDNADLSSPRPETADIGDPNKVTVGIGGDTVVQVGLENTFFNQWCTFRDAPAELTDDEVREEIFEKGALCMNCIDTDTEANMQGHLDEEAGYNTLDNPVDIRIAAVSGGGDLTLTSDGIIHNARSSVHVQFMGTGGDTLTWRNINGANASKGSTPDGGNITFVTVIDVTFTVRDAGDSSVIEGARVRVTAGATGPLTEGTEIFQGVTNASGVVTFEFDHESDQSFNLVSRKHSTSPYFKAANSSGTFQATDFASDIFMVGDE